MQKVFDVENADDMALLWDILPDDVIRIKPIIGIENRIEFDNDEFNTILFAINWHDKTEITRPIQEATEDDIGKICKFWDYEGDRRRHYGVLTRIGEYYEIENGPLYKHCRRLTKQEIEELC